MALNIDPLVIAYGGRRVEVAGGPLYQCVDLVNAWLRMLKKPIITGRNAIDFKSVPGYTYVPNSPSFLPQEGDIAIFNIGPYGDVAVVDKGTTLKDLVVFGQNYPIGAPCRIRAHKNYGGVAGFLTLSNKASSTYTVVAGDGLIRIGQKTGKDWKQIAAKNNIKPPYSLKVGQKLTLP